MNLREEITRALNRASAENGSNTPDFILAEYLLDALAAYDKAVQARSTWYGRHDAPGQGATTTGDVEPLRPEGVALAKKTTFPPVVLEAFNELIAADFVNGRATVRQDAVLTLILSKLREKGQEIERQQVFDRGWLNVEDIYRRDGWSVEYDKPGLGESYPATYRFTRKRG